MTLITDTVRHLVSRRLLPFVVALLVALVAVPLVLAREPDPVAPPPAPAPATAEKVAAPAQPVVALASDGTAGRRRRVLGARKNPFEPARAPKPRTSMAKAPAQPAATAGTPAPAGSGGSGSFAAPAPSSPPAAAAPAPAAGAAPEKRAAKRHVLTVNFGSADAAELDRIGLDRLDALPDEDEPLLIFLGVSADGRARFLLDTGIEAQGDGICKPDPATCETIELREGDTEFFDVKDESGKVTAQYQLDVVDIRERRRASASRARTARTATAAHTAPAAARVAEHFGSGL